MIRDPMTKALKAQSTHRELGARLSVYDRLGISQPGFWAHQSKRKVEESEDYGSSAEEVTAPSYEGLQPFKAQEFEWGTVSKKKTQAAPSSLYNAQVVAGAGKGSAAATKQFKTQLNAVVANNWKSIGKAHPWLDASSSNMLAAEKYATSYHIAQAFGEALRKDPHAMLNKVATDYYFAKANAAAVARMNVPFGHLPTQFEQLQATLAKAKQPIKGNTKNVSVQQMKQQHLKQRVSMATPRMPLSNLRPQLNVKQNGYASTYTGFHW